MISGKGTSYFRRGITAVVIAVFFLPLTACSGSSRNTSGHEVVTIASFNMHIFGKSKTGRPNTLAVLAKIASNFDIIALQEVGSNNSAATEGTCTEVMDKYTAKVNEAAGNDSYAYIRGNQYAIVYNKARVRVNSYEVYSGTQAFAYKPLVANFSIIIPGSNFDFSIITIHTSPPSAETEIPALKTAMDEIRILYSEPDVICLGDYNADGTYYPEGPDEWLAGFDPSQYITGVPNSFDTTVAESANTYDRIQMTNSLLSDFTGRSDVFIFGKVYDVSACEGTAKTSGKEEAVSDHYPVWAEYYTDKDTD